MTLLEHINAALKPFLTGAGALWHNDVEPFFANLLGSVSHAEVTLVANTATAYVEQALPALTRAAASGDWQGFAAAQGKVLADTADALAANAEKVAVTSLTTGIAALVAGHPAVVAATAQASAVAVTPVSAEPDAPVAEPDPATE